MSEPTPLTDEALVLRTLEDRNAFAELIDRYEAKLMRYLQRLGVRTLEDRQDVLQETFIKAYRNLNGFDTSLSFSSWLYRIAHNEAVSWFRKQNVRPEGNLIADSEELMPFVADGEETAPVLFDQQVNATVLGEALAGLDNKYRQPLILRYFEHKNYDEISDILMIPVGSVGTLIHRGKKQLAAVIDEAALRIQ